MKEQNMRGLPEEDWFRWVCLLVNAGYPEAAKAFSEMSTKHDGRSEERIQQVTEKVGEGGGLMTRCTTFGCGEDRIRSCFVILNQHDDGEITNSPGAFIKDMDSPLPPTDSAYAPYILALENIADYSIDEHGNLVGFDRKGNPFAVANFVARPVLEVIKN